MDLVIFGDFNCPFSALASARADELERRGVARIDWRAVEHEPAIPPGGEPVEGELRAELDEEVGKVRGLLVGAEQFPTHWPAVRSNTRAATDRYAGVEPARRAAVRGELFRRYWELGEDLGDARVLDEVIVVAADAGDAGTAEAWQREWNDLGQPVIPTLRLPDGYVSRGLGALRRLAEMLDPPDGGDGSG
jgi:predicted DsbA family dithiol-disulfide isomerase